MIDKNDPRLTAYALGELSQEEAAEFEPLLAGSPEAQQEVESIRQTAQWIRTGLSKESMPALTPEQRQKITAAAADNPAEERGWNLLRWGVLAAAACLVLAGLLLPRLRSAAEKTTIASTYNGEAELEQTDAEVKTPRPEPASEIADDRRSEESELAVDALAARREMEPSPKPKPQASASNVKAARKAPADKQDLHVRRHVSPGRGGQPETSRPRLKFPGVKTKPAEALSARVAGAETRQQMRPSFSSADSDASTPRNGLAREAYDRIYENPFRTTTEEPLSTFSVDVDTASYSNVRRFLNRNQLPPPDAVRIEEMVNYFRYGYSPPTDDHPFAVHTDVATAPWKPAHRLVRIGLKGRVPDRGTRPPANLVFLLDVSGSMRAPDKLPLLKSGLTMLTEQLGEHDRVAIVVYAGASGLVLPSTPADRKERILTALDSLQASGSTNAGAGIELAYRLAVENSMENGINRVILATDGDFNVGITDRGQLTRLIEEKARAGVFLTVLGFGTGNLQDATMEQLADKGNGVYAYLDSLREARKVLVEQVGSTLHTIAKDVKIQVEFNPAQVQAHRLVGYENRILHHQDFSDDSIDAGEIGAGHTVTAFYEIIPVDSQPRLDVAGDALRYQKSRQLTATAAGKELLTVNLRYKQPDGDTSTSMRIPVENSSQSWEETTDDFQFGSAVALFGMILRGSTHCGDASLDTVMELAAPAAQEDPHQTRMEFLELVEKAKTLKTP